MPYSFDFSVALQYLQNGKSVRRIGWNGSHTITLQTPTDTSKMTSPYIYITTDGGDIVPWVASQTDLLSKDWTIE